MGTVFHFAPARGWFNDPNGLIEYGGVHHFFFQHNPDQLAMRDMCWGHATSTDLVRWTEQPIALRPGAPGSPDDDGCWSGCAVRDGDAVVAVYSGNHEGIQLPCLARALDDDLVRWEKSADNPVIAGRPPVAGVTDMRDHSVRWDGGRWRQVLAGGVSGQGVLFGYSSPDLTSWTWDGVLLTAGDAGLPGRVWECPDVFEVDGRVVAIVSVIDDDRSPVLWIVGDLDGARLSVDRWGLVDSGNRLYAPQSYTDASGRRIMFGWLRTHHDPGAGGRPSLGVASAPRVLRLVGGRVHQEPAHELERLRGEPRHVRPDPGDQVLELAVDGIPALELRVACASTTDLVGVTVTVTDGTGARMRVDLAAFAVPTGSPAGGAGDGGDGGPRVATVLFDTGIAEVFLDDGRAGAWTQVAVSSAHEVVVSWSAGAPGEVTLWPLRDPDDTVAPQAVADPVSTPATV